MTITASNETINSASAGDGALEIASLNATLHGLHFHGFSSSATVDQFNATALITFTALANVGGIPQGITLTPDGPNQVKATVSLGPFSDSAVAQVTQSGREPDQRPSHQRRRDTGLRPGEPGELHHQHPEAPGRE